MSDMERSFSFLQDNIPTWLQAISTAEKKVTAMQEDFTDMAASQSPLVKKKKTDSIESIRPGKLDATTEHAPSSNGAQTDPLGKRKRKTTSALSGGVSGPSRYRSRTMVVVTYDGDMQKSFEELVRAIGAGRNMLRKAKMEAKMNELDALQESSDDTEGDNTKDEQEVDMSRANYRSRMSSMRARAAARRSGRLGFGGGSNPTVEVFNKTDKTLEHAQELCEKAAHLTLRDGDCRKELEGARKDFETVLETAKNEVVKCCARKSQEPPELVSQDTSDTSVSSIDTPDQDHYPQVSLPVPDAIPKPSLSTATGAVAPAEPRIVDIEVDDDNEDGDEEFVMPPIRLTSRFGVRG